MAGRQAQIAKQLKLSQATVSRALRGHVGISAEVQARVLAAAKDVGYVARWSATRPGAPTDAERFVGVLVLAENERWRRGGYLVGVSEASLELDITPVIHQVSPDHEDEILDPRRQPLLMRNARLDGLVLIFHWPRHVVAELCKRFRCVSLQHEYAGLPVDVIGVHSGEAVLSLVRHLQDFGHRRIGFFGRSPDLTWAENRFDGYVAAMARLNLESYRPERVIAVEAPEMGAVVRPGDPWGPLLDAAAAQTRAGVTAWVAASDYVGYQLCRGLRERGLRVPQDVSVTGFDVSQFGAFGCDKLTSVSVPSKEMGAAALSLAGQRKRLWSATSATVLFGATLEVGETTGPVPSRR